ncbi:paraneoplastic antigen Ma2-like [Patiria miniata]|uniref:CCHC-type domain-containing protein n=1 Tax=Patiria miniata TaxID=46514 RepID=A0A914AHN7_PATMI|nr:paraneoplastic antigen Ma2-like [Patiria miniata]
MASEAPSQVEITDWCKKEDIRPSHALLLKADGILTDTTEDILIALAKTVQHIMSVSRREKNVATQLLCEFEKESSDVVLPSSGEVSLKLGGRHVQLNINRLGVVVKNRVRIQDLVEKGLMPTTQEKKNANQLGEALARCTLNSSRKLRPFSGSKTPAKDEDVFDTWIELAKGQLDEEENDQEKRKRIREALRPPAANIISDLRRDQQAATSEDYLGALELAFGGTESATELHVLFHSSHQKQGETPSEYLTRLQDILRRLIRKGRVEKEKKDGLLLSQFIKGILYDEMLLVNLQLKEKVSQPPTYLQLLRMVRREEAEQMVKMSHRSVDAPKKEAKTFHQSAGSKEVGEKRKTPTNSRPNFCYKCGLEGHYKGKCPNEPDVEKVNSALIKFIHQGNGTGHLRGAAQKPKE